MGWGLTTEVKNTDSSKTGNESMYGTRSPNLSPGFTDAVTTFKNNLNPAGYNPTQQAGVDGLLRASTTGAAQNRQGMENVNGYIMGRGAQLNGMATSPTAHTATASVSAPTSTIGAKTAADYVGLYKDAYGKDIIDPALASYDANAAKAKAGFTASTAGAFGNKRTGVAESNFANDTATGRAALQGNLLSTGFQTAGELAQGDAGRTLSADTSNAGNLLSNNQFNANLLTNNSQYNAGAADRADQRQLDAVAQQTGIAQTMLQNVFNTNGFDMEAAQSLLAAGSISQSQFDNLVNYASAGNGSSFTQNTDSRSNTNTTEVGAKASFGV